MTIPRLLVFDIESRPSPAALADFEPKFEPKEEPRPAVPRNLKDPAKIAAAELEVAERMEQWHLNRGKSLAEQAEQWEQDGCLRAERGEVLAIGWKVDDSVSILHPYDYSKERAENGAEEIIIRDFLSTLEHYADKGYTVAGHNIKGFDLPFIRRRCLVLGIPFPWYDRSQKWEPWRFPIYDSMVDWQCGNYRDKFISLDDLARGLKLPGKTKGEVTGENFHRFYANPETREMALDYLRGDVVTGDAVCRRLLA